MSEENRKVTEAEQLIQRLRDGETEAYPEIREKLLETELSEEDFSSEVLFRWYEMIRVVSPEDFAKRSGVRMTVSMTSWTARIGVAAETLKGIYSQSRKADRVLLWLAEEQFPGKEADLPEALMEQVKEGKVEIRWCEDLKSHKKYFFALQEDTDGVTVTVDDDLIYPEEMLEVLWLSWLRHPQAVSAMRTHYMAVTEDGRILPYEYWVKETDARVDQPDMRLFATTGAGTLYPAGIIGKEWFDREAILATCLATDDLWMKAAETMLGIPVVQACKNRSLKYIPGSQEETLWTQNREENDIQLQKILKWTDGKYGPGALGKKLAANGNGLEEYAVFACRETDKLKAKLKQTYAEKSGLNKELKATRAQLGMEGRSFRSRSFGLLRQGPNPTQATLWLAPDVPRRLSNGRQENE